MYIFKKFCSILHKKSNSNESKMAHLQTQPSIDQAGVEGYQDTHEDLRMPFLITDTNDKCEPSAPAELINNEVSIDSIPNVYINVKLLKQVQGETDSYRETIREIFLYEINGTAFWDDVTNTDKYIKEADKLFEFEIIDHKCNLNDNAISEENKVKECKDDEMCKVQRSSENTLQSNSKMQKKVETDASDFPIVIQSTPYGLVINSNILLTENGWNTIICGNHTMCIACNTSLDIRDIADHIVSDNHKDILEEFKPLKEFDINMVRKINERYHCAICNIIFDIADTEHVESHSHGENVLKSINKVSDITEIDVDEFEICSIETRSLRKDHIDFNAIAKDSSGLDSERFDGFYNDASVEYCNESEIDDKDCYEKIDKNLFSYADAAKKSKLFSTSNYVHIKLSDKYAKVRFDCWHTINILETNTFYCMACKEKGPIRYKSDHCMSVSHVEKLMKCNLVSDYKEHVIRKVDDKFYHCGHCNNLQVKDEIGHHIETTHMKTNWNINRTEKDMLPKRTVNRAATASPKVSNDNSKSTNTYNPPDRSAVASPIVANDNFEIAESIAKENSEAVTTNADLPRNVSNTLNITANPNDNNAPNTIHQRNTNVINHPVPPNIHTFNLEQIVIREFGLTYTISFLAYHLIQQQTLNSYICLICNAWCTNGVWNHALDPVHTARIAKVAFLPQTSFHLIRETKYGFHCIICNIFIQNNPINHTWDAIHLALLKRAVCVTSLPQILPNSQFGAPIFYQNIPKSVPNNQMFVTKVETEESNKKVKKQDDDKSKMDKVENKVTETVESNDFDTEDKTKSDKIVKVNNKVKDTIEGNDFDTEEYVYIKIKNDYIKITMTSYHGLVPTGNGTRHCVLCSIEVMFKDLKSHVSSPDHSENMKKYKFLDKYERHLLRQTSTYYHCALCNVCIIKSFFSHHLNWPLHRKNEANKITKCIRRKEIKSGVKEFACSTQKEIDNNDMKSEFEILFNIEIRPQVHHDVVKKKKIVIVDDVVFKLSWDAFHGVCKSKNGYKCLICQTDVKTYELSTHTESSRHTQVLENSFQLKFSPALIRKVNNSTLHCLTCNVEVNSEHTLEDHIASKRHIKNYNSTIAEKTDSDIVDNTDILVLRGNEVNKNKKKAR